MSLWKAKIFLRSSINLIRLGGHLSWFLTCGSFLCQSYLLKIKARRPFSRPLCGQAPTMRCSCTRWGGGVSRGRRCLCGDPSLERTEVEKNRHLSQVSWPWAMWRVLDCEGVAKWVSPSLQRHWTLIVAAWWQGLAPGPSWRFGALLFSKVLSYIKKPEQSLLWAVKNPAHDRACDQYLQIKILGAKGHLWDINLFSFFCNIRKETRELLRPFSSL